MPHEVVDEPNAFDLKIQQGEIELRDVQFQYENHPPIFENFNLKIQAGEKVGLVATLAAENPH